MPGRLCAIGASARDTICAVRPSGPAAWMACAACSVSGAAMALTTSANGRDNCQKALSVHGLARGPRKAAGIRRRTHGSPDWLANSGLPARSNTTTPKGSRFSMSSDNRPRATSSCMRSRRRMASRRCGITQSSARASASA
ncbi:hypothetical protein D3C86_1701290 [compost metagenome]